MSPTERVCENEVTKMTSQPKVLIVDDDILCAESLVFFVEIMDLKALKAFSAEQALEIFKGDNVDLVISDVTMPGMSGIELLQELKKLDPGLPVIIVSGSTDDFLREEAAKSGALGFLSKPIHHKALISMIRAGLDKKMEDVEVQEVFVD
jgi:DNA-binding NtrC family response regulator